MHTIKIYKVKNTNEVILNIQDNSLEDIIKIEYDKKLGLLKIYVNGWEE